MGKISKLFKGEVKKIFLSTGIFIMTALLILVLTISPKLFEPIQKSDLSTSVTLSTSSIEDLYDSFLLEKNELQSKKDLIENEYNKLILGNENFIENLKTYSSNIYNLRATLSGLVYSGSNTAKLTCLNNLITETEKFKEYYDNCLNNYYIPVILVTEELDFNITFELEILLKLLNKDGNKETDEFYLKLNNSLENYGSAYNLKEYAKQIKNLNYSSDNLKSTIDEYKDKNLEYKNKLLANINKNLNKATSDDDYNIGLTGINETKEYILSYLASDNNYIDVLQNKLLLEISIDHKDSEISNYIKFENFNSYGISEKVNKSLYLYTNNFADYDFASVYSFNANSSSKTNAFDYVYFALEVASFLIIAFSVIVGASMIAKEYSDGTIKLLAIRPFSRNKIMLSKILATMFFAFIFVIVSLIVALITGCILYDFSIMNMLIVFNATTVFVIPNWVVLLIYLASLFIKIWIFVLLSIVISTIFKSYVAAVIISSGIYILNIIINFISKGATWLKYNVFANLDLFKFFGGSFRLTYTQNQNLNNLFLSPVFADTTIWYTIGIILASSLILNIILFTVFKHRDIT